MDTQAIAFEMDMATMALKGRRFREAEEKFKELAMRNQSTEAWCGLGISKFGLIMEDLTIEEVFYCFDKAKGIDADKAAELETVVIETSIDVIKNLYDVIMLTQESIEKAETERAKAAIATLAGTVMTANNSRNNRVFGSIASAGLTALSYTGYVKAGSTIIEMKALHDNVTEHIKNIEALLKRFVTKETALMDKFSKVLNEKHIHVEVNVPMAKDIEKMKNRLTWYNWGFWLCIFFTFVMMDRYYEEHDKEDLGTILALAIGAWLLWMKRKKLKKEVTEKEAALSKSQLQISSTQ